MRNPVVVLIITFLRSDFLSYMAMRKMLAQHLWHLPLFEVTGENGMQSFTVTRHLPLFEVIREKGMQSFTVTRNLTREICPHQYVMLKENDLARV